MDNKIDLKGLKTTVMDILAKEEIVLSDFRMERKFRYIQERDLVPNERNMVTVTISFDMVEDDTFCENLNEL